MQESDRQYRQAFDRLARIASTEAARGYDDGTVQGGLGRFLLRWAEEVRRFGERGRAAADLAVKAEPYSRWPQAARADQLPKLLKLLQFDAGTTPTATPSPAGTFAPVSSLSQPARKPRQVGKPAGPLALESPISAVKGVGPSNAGKFQKLGVRTAGDLLRLYPRRYNDYSNVTPIREAKPGTDVTLLLRVLEIRERRGPSGRRMSEAWLTDGPDRIRASWFTPYPAQQLRPGQAIAVSGSISLFNGRRVLEHPEYEVIDGEELTHTGRLVPVYPATEGLYQKTIRNAARSVLDLADAVTDPLPAPLREAARLYSLPRALRSIHFPESLDDQASAQRRLAFDELFVLQVGMLARRRDWKREGSAPAMVRNPQAALAFEKSLPFPMTGAQRRVLGEIALDLTQSVPMSRLVQGEVGSGKTVVAAGALHMAFTNGLQGAMMAPTEILAEQHARSLAALLGSVEPAPRVELVTGSLPARRRRDIRDRLAAGEIDVIVGTQAIIQGDLEFARLGLAVVDEQHRFGVMQRGALRKAEQREAGTPQPARQARLDVVPAIEPAAEVKVPHMLVMTATPIPRSLALTVYGDLDLSLIDDMPPGRAPIRTQWLTPERRDAGYALIRQELDAGHQAFIVYPLVEESERSESKAAVDEAKRLATDVFPDRRIGLLHGRMSSQQKDLAMRAFKNHETDILVSTAVVEVGVDVPNATVMMIEGADRFGLAQLHQFRGRVGRGSAPGFCVLIADETDNITTQERLRALERTTNGLELAEIDLKLRGPGDFLGTRQSGLPALRLASVTDLDLVQQTRSVAQQLIDEDPDLEHPEHARLKEAVATLFAAAETDVS